jgi:hypothetical protein
MLRLGVSRVVLAGWLAAMPLAGSAVVGQSSDVDAGAITLKPVKAGLDPGR